MWLFQFSTCYFIALLVELFNCIKNQQLKLTIEENREANSLSPIGNVLNLILNQTNSTRVVNYNSYNLAVADSDSYNNQNYLNINTKTGDIFLRSSIDRESICKLYQNCEADKTFLDFLIFADKDIFELTVFVKDLNDIYPTFIPDEKFIKIPEGTSINTTYSLPTAKDEDSSEYGVVKYELDVNSGGSDTAKDYFQLSKDKKSPYLIVTKLIDREKIKQFEFYLYAIDGGGKRGKCKIIIEVSDINDNTPQWIGLPYTRQIKECTSEDQVVKLIAEDYDDPLTEGGQITFRISENTRYYDLFYITDKSLNLNKGALKSINKDRIKVLVLAIDGGGRRNETEVDITILDCNDHSPEISLEKDVLSIEENRKVETELSRITVEDKDKNENSNFHCFLNDTTRLKLIEKFSRNFPMGNKLKVYSLLTRIDVSFDRELESQYFVLLTCKDNGQPIMSSLRRITIYIIDQNDNPPIFPERFYTFSIAEDVERGKILGRVEAVDQDSSGNSKTQYKLLGDEETLNTFRIHNSAEIQILKPLDRETIDKYQFKIEARDKTASHLYDVTTVSVMVLDVNDCSPLINNIHKYQVVESYDRAPIHVSLGRLNASDADLGFNSSVLFRLAGVTSPQGHLLRHGPLYKLMRVLDDGRLTIYGLVDREQLPAQLEYQIWVMDRGTPPLTSSTTVIIDVLDLNDNRPHLDKEIIHLNVSQDIPIGTTLITLTAKDPDLQENGTLMYREYPSVITNHLVGNSSLSKPQPKYLVHSDGQVVLNRALSQFPQSSRYMTTDSLHIQISDKGKPPQTTNCRLFIHFHLPKLPDRPVNIPQGASQSNTHDVINNNNVKQYHNMGGKYPNRGQHPNPRNTRYNNKNIHGSTSKKWWDSKLLLILLISTIAAIILVFIAVLFCYAKNQRFPNGNTSHNAHNPKAKRIRHSTHDQMAVDPSIGNYQHKQISAKLLKDKSLTSLDTDQHHQQFPQYRLDMPSQYPQDNDSLLECGSPPIIRSQHHPPNSCSSALGSQTLPPSQYTNLSWLKNEFYTQQQPPSSLLHHTGSQSPHLSHQNYSQRHTSSKSISSQQQHLPPSSISSHQSINPHPHQIKMNCVTQSFV